MRRSLTADFKDKANAFDEDRLHIESDAIKLVEKRDYDAALVKMTEAVNKFPEHPSPLNNRAQIYRLMRKDEEAMADLNDAIKLKPMGEYPLVMRRAHMQRGLLLMASNDNAGAKADFEAALALGQTDAGKFITRCNPYAALCNAMIMQVMEKYYSS